MYLLQGYITPQFESFKGLREWQFLTMKAAETLCIVCLPPEKHTSWTKIG